MSLPRALTALPDGKLSIQPYKGIDQLRKESISVPDFEVETDCQVNISDLAECTMFFGQSERRLELIYDIELVPCETPTEGGFSMLLFHEEDVEGGQFETEIGMNYEENLVYHGKEHGFIDLKNIKTFHIHQFMDNSVIETFIGDSDVITTRLYPRPNASPQISFKTMDFGIKVKNLKIWRLKPIWD
jgi:sucrose-6-phosphate hydrolase SacC (GH32 family)